MAILKYRTTTNAAGSAPSAPASWSAWPAGGVLTNEEIDKNFATLNASKLESESDTLASVAARGASTSTNLSMTGANTLGAAGVTTTINGTILNGSMKSPDNTGFWIRGGDITSTAGNNSTISGSNRTSGAAGFSDSAGNLIIKGGELTYGDGPNNFGGDLYLLGGGVGIGNGVGGSVHIVSGSFEVNASGSKTSGSIHIDVAKAGYNLAYTKGEIKIGAGTAVIPGYSTDTNAKITLGGSGSIINLAGSAELNGTATFKNSNGFTMAVDGITTYGYWDSFGGLYVGDAVNGVGKITVASTNSILRFEASTVAGQHGKIRTSTNGLDIQVDNIATTHARFTTTSFTHIGDIIAYGTLSDISLKENIVRITDGLDRVKQLNGYTFNYKGKSSKMIGVIAQELEKVAPELVFENENIETGEVTKGVRYSQITALLIEAVKELSAKVEDLQNQLDNK